MPKTPIDYQTTVIYKIQHIEKDDLLYVGHTTNFTKRKNNHKSKCTKPDNSKYNLKIYQMIRDNGGWDMFKMIEIKKFPCNDDREACTEEDKLMRAMKATMNSISAIFDDEKLTLNRRRSDQKRSNTAERIEFRKSYYEENKDKIKAQKKKWDEAHAQETKDWRTEILQCECGCFIARKTENGSKHLKSQRHKDGMKMFAPRIC